MGLEVRLLIYLTPKITKILSSWSPFLIYLQTCVSLDSLPEMSLSCEPLLFIKKKEFSCKVRLKLLCSSELLADEKHPEEAAPPIRVHGRGVGHRDKQAVAGAEGKQASLVSRMQREIGIPRPAGGPACLHQQDGNGVWAHLGPGKAGVIREEPKQIFPHIR